ncbi:MAG: polysaccharide pyruvyl transferase family protein [Alphaproteobacteria bacterium]
MSQSPLRIALFNETRALGHHGCSLVSRRIHTLAARHDMVVHHAVAGDGDGRAERYIADCDLVLVNGEGSIHSSNHNAHRLTALAPLARQHGKPAILLNALYQGNDASIAEATRSFDAIWVRDQISQSELADHGLEATVVPDLTLSHKMPSLQERPYTQAEADKQLVITDSTLRNKSRALYDLYRRQNAAQPGSAAFLPFKARPPLMHTKPDYGLRRRIGFEAKYAGSRLWPAPSYSRDRYRFIIPDLDQCLGYLHHRASGVIAGRFHALCMALVLGVPVMAVGSNTRKIEPLLAAAGLQDRLLPHLPDSIGSVPDYTPAEQTARLAFLADCQSRADQMFKKVAQIARVTNDHA